MKAPIKHDIKALLLGAITPPSRKSLPFLKKHKNEIFFFFISIVLTFALLLKMSIGNAKTIETTHDKSFKENDGSIAM